MNKRDYEIISNEPAFWSRIGFADDPTRLDENGNVTFYSENWDNFIREHKSFAEKGIKLHTGILHNGWVGVSEYDFRAVDRTLEAIFSVSDEIYYMPRIKLNPPISWTFANPTEAALSYGAKRDTESIVRLVRKMSPYYTTSGISGNTPRSDEGYAYLFSFCSEKWLRDACTALDKLIEHINSTPYAERIVAYQIGMGMCAENAIWGAWSEDKLKWGDYGITAARCFERFAVAKYGSREKVEEAYGMSYSDAYELIPTPNEKYHEPTSFDDFFRAGNQKSIDYAEFMSNSCADAILGIASHLKKLTDGKPVGTFYGYIHTGNPTDSGHLAVDKLLASPYIDFIASPKGYFATEAGRSGGEQACPMSVVRKKIWFDELDNNTHIGKRFHAAHLAPATMSETSTVYWREICKELAWGNLNFWFMDLAGNWFDDREIMDEMERIIAFYKEMRKKPRAPVSEILLVTDDRSTMYHNADRRMMGSTGEGVLNDTACELLSCGAPVDIYRLSELCEIDTSCYKMVVFANSYFADEKTAEKMRGLAAEKLCVFNYAPAVHGRKYGIENVFDVTGMAIEPFDAPFDVSDGYACGVKMPPVRILPHDGLAVLDTYPDGGIKTAKYKNSVLCTACGMKSEDFHRMAAEAGCHMYADAGVTVYADSRFVGVFPRDDIYTVKMTRESVFRDVKNEKTYKGDCIDVHIESKGAAVFTESNAF